MERKKKTACATASKQTELKEKLAEIYTLLQCFNDAAEDLRRACDEQSRIRQVIADLRRDISKMRNDVSVVSRPTLNRQEAAVYSGMGESALIKYSNQGLIKSYKAGGKVYYDKQDLLDFMHRVEITPKNEMREEIEERIRNKNTQSIEPKSFLDTLNR